jgi:23S rRNA (uridine2552-2'-O)-methyltransferase
VLSIAPAVLLQALPAERRGCFQVVLSDMAPDTSGIPFTDQVRSVELFGRALVLCNLLGCPQSSLCGKLFMGEGFDEMLERLRQSFEQVKVVRPAATRRCSAEAYLVGIRQRSGARRGA